MAKFRKKAVLIEATQWFKDGDHQKVEVWTRGGHVFVNGKSYIDTFDTKELVEPGDWIVTSMYGGYIVCKPDDFAETYEPA